MDIDLEADYVDELSIGGSEAGVRVSGDSRGVELSGEIYGYEKGVVHESGELTIKDALITGNLIGYIARKEAEGQIENTTFDNFIADIIYHPDTDVEKIEGHAKTVLELTGGNVTPIEADLHLQAVEIELNREARKVVTASSDDEKREHFLRMVKIVREYELSTTEGVILGTAASKFLDFIVSKMASELPDILSQFGF